MRPCRPLYGYIFLLEMWDPLRPETPQKYENPNICRTKSKKQIHSLTVRQGNIKHGCKISGSLSQKLCGHWTLKEVGAISLNQPVLIIYLTPKLALSKNPLLSR